jgi:hypothetical protein
VTGRPESGLNGSQPNPTPRAEAAESLSAVHHDSARRADEARLGAEARAADAERIAAEERQRATTMADLLRQALPHNEERPQEDDER